MQINTGWIHSIFKSPDPFNRTTVSFRRQKSTFSFRVTWHLWWGLWQWKEYFKILCRFFHLLLLSIIFKWYFKNIL